MFRLHSSNSAVGCCGYYLTQTFYSNIAGSKYAGNIGMHIVIGTDVSILHIQLAFK